jgi:hypothetical protein
VDRVVRDARALGPGELESEGPWRARTRDAGVGGSDAFAPGLRADVRVEQELAWIRVPRVLSYVSRFGAARATVAGAGELAGLGLVEHAWGTATRIDVAKLAPRRWQWDVLWLGGDAYFAGLAFGAAGRAWGPHGGARLPDGRAARVRSFGVRVREWRDEDGRRVPLAWSAEMRAGKSRLRYQARASTPAAAEVEGGGFLGFDYEGALDGRPVAGTGFCEYRAA